MAWLLLHFQGSAHGGQDISVGDQLGVQDVPVFRVSLSCMLAPEPPGLGKSLTPALLPRTWPCWWWVWEPSSLCSSTWVPRRVAGPNTGGQNPMSTAPWCPLQPSHCCYGNTGFGSPLSIRYVVGLRGPKKPEPPRTDIASGSHSHTQSRHY